MRAYLIVMLLLPLASMAQKIHYTDAGNRWLWEWQSGDPITSWSRRIYTPTDTAIGPYTYKRLIYYFNYLTTPSLEAFVREDTLAKKVFILYPAPADSMEYTLFDYNLSVGDTFHFKNQAVYRPHILHTLDSVQINGVYYKRQTFLPDSNIGFCGSYQVVEGIGMIQGIEPNLCSEGTGRLLCFTNDVSQPQLYGQAGFHNSCSLGIGDLKSPASSLIYPNPVGPLATIRLPSTLADGRLVILDAFGRRLLERNFKDLKEPTFPTTSFPPGCYYYRIMDLRGSRSYSGSFVK